MELDRNSAAKVAADFFGVATPLEPLGWGISGFVYLSPDSRTAVKVHRGEAGFIRELEVYRILRKLGITQLHGLNVPKLRGVSINARLIQMDVVNKPYLLDFAGVLYEPPDYPLDKMELWHQDIARYYGPNAHVAYAVYNTLAGYGLYYVDIRPSNLNIEGLPELEPHDPGADDDPW